MTTVTWLTRAVLCVYLACLASVGVAQAAPAQPQPPPAQPQQPVHFDAETVLVINPAGSKETALLNDSAESFAIETRATLDPPAGTDGEPVPVAVALDLGEGFRSPAETTRLPPTARMRVRLTAPADARPGASGSLTIVATSDARTLVARRPISVSLPKPTVESWSVTSTQWVPWRDVGGALEPPLPLAPQTGCEALGNPATALVSRDQTVSITSKCEESGLELTAGDFSPGTYAGKLEIGAATVKLEVRRTMSMVWPIALIILGVFTAIAVRARLDQGWWWQRQRWLDNLPDAAAQSDVLYHAAAGEWPWEAYELEPAIETEAAALRRRLDKIAKERRWLLRWLPWPDEFMSAEREAIRARIAELDELISTWPTMSEVFGTARSRVNQQPYYLTRAPKLVERTLVIVGAAGLPIDASELAARCAEAAVLPDALDVVDDLEQLDAYLKALELDPATLPAQDIEVRVRARQYERQASATLAELADATKVVALVGRPVEHAARLASRLPKPSEDAVDQVQEETMAAEQLVPSLPLALIRRVTALFGRRAVPLGEGAVILLTLAVGVLSGLAVLYVGKAWGGSWTDYAAAFVWGYVASTVIDPIVSAVRQLGTRAADAAESASK